MRSLLFILLALGSASAGCGDASRVAVSPLGQVVVASQEGPPAGARAVGPVAMTHGGGCGVFAERGSYEGAVSMLRNRVAELGGNYVQILNVTEPHAEATCFDGGYLVRGLGYFVPAISAEKAPEPTAQAPVPPPPSTSTAAQVEPPRPGVCEPPCSPGFECKAGACIPLCNPPCEANEICNRHRACELAATPPALAGPRSTIATPERDGGASR